MSSRLKEITKIALILLGVFTVLILFGYYGLGEKNKMNGAKIQEIPKIDKKAPDETKTATFALGCFWGPDAKFGAQKGVVRTRVGYSGGSTENPTYKNLGDHTETVQMDYDPNETSYRELINIFWNSHVATYPRRRQYMSIIFYHNETQKEIAEETKSEIEKELGENVVTEIVQYSKFHLAENYHQKHHLRRFEGLLEAFENIYPKTEDLIKSTATTRANGYLQVTGKLNLSRTLRI